MALVKRSTAAHEEKMSVKEARTALDAFKPGNDLLAVRSTALQMPTPLQVIKLDPKLADNEYERLRACVRMDKHRLDDHAITHAEHFAEIAERAALATSLADQAKDALARKDAELMRAKRMKPDEGEKLTEKSIEAYVLLHEEHIAAAQEHAQLSYAQARWKALERAFDQRMKAMRELVGLYVSGYWTSSGSVGARASLDVATAEQRRERIADQRKGQHG